MMKKFGLGIIDSLSLKCNKGLQCRFWRPKIRFLVLVRQPIESSQRDLRNGGLKINL